jgi:hypothetical protein
MSVREPEFIPSILDHVSLDGPTAFPHEKLIAAKTEMRMMIFTISTP